MSVFIVGGPSNVGKTTAASAIAQQMGCTVLAVDDLARRSTAPALAFERDPATWTRPPPELVRLLINKGETLWPEVRTATSETLASRGTLVIEGEGPAPAAMATFRADDVRSAFIVELDGEILDRTLTSRSAAYRALPPAQRANVVAMNVGYGGWLVEECEREGQTWLPSQPWSTLRERLAEAWA